MKIQSGIPPNFYHRRVKMVLFLIVGLVLAAFPDANAFPVFCSDITSAQVNSLTGCDLNADPSNLQRASLPAVVLPHGESEVVDAVLMKETKNRLLFQVGRIALSDDRDRRKGRGASAGKKQTESGIEMEVNSSDRESNLLDQDEGWYYMNIDQDGTYLFFGDLPDTDELMTNGDENDFLPDGIGIGKRWRF